MSDQNKKLIRNRTAEFLIFTGQPGVVLYDGETAVRFGDRLFAIPISVLWK